MAQKYKLTYFPVRSIGEPIRYLLSYGNIEFEDKRVSNEEWPYFKKNTPINQLPILEIDDKLYHQAMAITRFLGTKLGLAGKTPEENLEIDMAVYTVDDLRAKMAIAAYDIDEDHKEKLYKILIKDKVPLLLKNLEANAAANKGHMALGKLTWADFHFAGVVDYLSHISRTDILAQCPNLKAVRDNVFAIPAVKAWNAKAPKSIY